MVSCLSDEVRFENAHYLLVMPGPYSRICVIKQKKSSGVRPKDTDGCDTGVR